MSAKYKTSENIEKNKIKGYLMFIDQKSQYI